MPSAALATTGTLDLLRIRMASILAALSELASSGRVAQVGDIKISAGRSPLPGHLPCDGSEYLISDYPDLAEELGDFWGEATRDGYFRVPDFRRRTFMGAATSVAYVECGTRVQVPIPGPDWREIYGFGNPETPLDETGQRDRGARGVGNPDRPPTQYDPLGAFDGGAVLAPEYYPRDSLGSYGGFAAYTQLRAQMARHRHITLWSRHNRHGFYDPKDDAWKQDGAGGDGGSNLAGGKWEYAGDFSRDGESQAIRPFSEANPSTEPDGDDVFWTSFNVERPNRQQAMITLPPYGIVNVWIKF